MEIGEISKLTQDIKDLFFLTQNKVLDKAECRKLLNEVRAKLGFAEMTKEDFERNFSGAPTQVRQIPQSNVKHAGQHHEVKVNVPEGQQQVVEAQKPEKLNTTKQEG